MNSSNLLFLIIVFSGPIIRISSSDWLVAWAGIEISIIGLFPLIIRHSSAKEASIKYFLIQSLARILLLIRGIFFFVFFIYKSIILLLIGLSLKIGFFPGQFWVPNLLRSLSWINNFLVLGPIKIAPLGFLRLVIINEYVKNLVLVLGLFRAFIGSLLGVNQTSVRAILGASSISHSGWILISIVYGYLWGYFFRYLIVLLFSIIGFFRGNFLLVRLNLLSIRGLPPFLIFVIKFKVLYSLIFSNNVFIFTILILSSVIRLSFYLKFFFTYLLNINQKNYLSLIVFSIVNVFGVIFILFFESNFAINF